MQLGTGMFPAHPRLGWQRREAETGCAYHGRGTPVWRTSSTSPAAPPRAAPGCRTGSARRHRSGWERRSAAWTRGQTTSLKRGCRQLLGTAGGPKGDGRVPPKRGHPGGDTQGGTPGHPTGDTLGMAVPLASPAALEARVLLPLLQGAGAGGQVLAPHPRLLLPPRPRQALQAVVETHAALQPVQPQPAEI